MMSYDSEFTRIYVNLSEGLMRFVFLQRYIWWKKSVDVWTKDHPFPIDIDYMISDTLELLRPKMRLSCSLDDATRQVADLEREVLVKLGEDEFPDEVVWRCSWFLWFPPSRAAFPAA